MRAVVCRHAELSVEERPEAPLGPGQVRLEVLRCGICGSDLHARTGMDAWADMAAKIGYERMARQGDGVVFGHEIAGAVAEYGPKTDKKLPTGTPVVAVPLVRTGSKVDAIGLSPHAPGAYAEQVVVQEPMMMAVPNGLPAEVAALTEPLAVAWHAVRRGEVKKKDVAIVVGCGPVGLGVILCLKARGVATVVASDPSPGRRALAARCGADVVVDPHANSPFAGGERHGHLTDPNEAFELVVGTREKLERLPIGWWHLWRLGEALTQVPKRPVIFECVGVPGMIESILGDAPIMSRIVVVGVCVGEDRITPFMAINKEIDLRFVLGYSPLEYRDTLHLLADGKIDPRAMITSTVGLDGVADAFTALADPEAEAKVLIDPRA